MPNPGSFRGSRKDFLMGEKEAYSQAVAGNYTSEALALICRRYFKRYPVDLSHQKEPSAEHLAAVDDNAPDPEIPEPDIFALSQEEYKEAMDKLSRRKDAIEFRKSQIKRWMAYQYMKDHHIDPKETGAHNPYRLLMCKLTGRTLERPRRKTPVNVWRKTRRAEIEHEVRQRHGNDIPKAQLATLRDRVARDMFGRLDNKTRLEWEVLAQEEHTVAVEQWSRDMEAPPSTNPVDRQRSIQGLVGFVQPILDMICDVTGWKASLIAGGPEPAQDGQLNVISIHSGTTSGEVKLTFGHAERANIKKTLVPMFGAFLQKCYTPVECRSRALAARDGHVRLADMDLDSRNISVHSIGQRRNGPPPITAAPNVTVPNVTVPSARPAVASKAPAPAVKVSSSMKPAVDPKAPVAASKAPLVAKAIVPCAPAPKPRSAASARVAVEDPGISAVEDISAPAVDGNGGNPPLGEVSGCLTEQEYILLGEANTLQKTTSPEDDEIEMTLSRSVSPSSTTISPVPSPLPSRCPSPILVSPTPSATNHEAENNVPAAACGIPLVDNDPTVLAVSVEVGPTTASVSQRGTRRAADPSITMPTSSKEPSISGLSPGRPRRKITKTSKLILMEEGNSRKGRKRGAGELEGKSNVDQAAQAPVKRRRVGKRM